MITTKHITTKQVKAKIEGLKRMSELNPEDYAEKDGWAESIVIDQKSSLNATQLRKIFHYVKSLRREFKQQGGLDRAKVAMMTPLLAYAAGRKHISDDFYDLLVTMFGSTRCQDRKDFESASNFLEAIMAYHKYYDKDNKK